MFRGRKRRNIPGVMPRCCAGTKTHLLRALAVPAPLIPVLHAVTFAVLVAVGVARLDLALPCLDAGRVGGRRRRPGVPVRVRDSGASLLFSIPAVWARSETRGASAAASAEVIVSWMNGSESVVTSFLRSVRASSDSRARSARVCCVSGAPEQNPGNTFFGKVTIFWREILFQEFFCSHAIGAADRRGWWASQTSDS